MRRPSIYYCIAAMFIGAGLCNVFTGDWTEVIADLCATCLALQLAEKTKNT